MYNQILLRANLKRHKGSMLGILILMLLLSLVLGTVLTEWINSRSYIADEMRRAGFGTLSSWVSDVPDVPRLSAEIAALPEVRHVEAQRIIFASYSAKEQESDSEGQLIAYDPQEQRYRFFTDDLSAYRTDWPDLAPGEVYVSPALVSMLGIELGDVIHFPLARAGVEAALTVKGFYEDPFMGSSMIGMKGFLICDADYAQFTQTLQVAGINALAREGAMLHIMADEASGLSASALNRTLNEQTELARYTEFTYSAQAIAGFMVILHSAFCGLMMAFALVLLLVVMAVLAHHINSMIEADVVNMAILKTMGLTGRNLRLLQMLQYLLVIAAGMISGLLLAIPVSRLVSSITLTTTGVRIPNTLPGIWCALSFLLLLLLLLGFIWRKTRKLEDIVPMQAIRGEWRAPAVRHMSRSPLSGQPLHLQLAIRQVLTNKRLYQGVCLTAILLVLFASLLGRMDSWLGAEGQGMMEAFNPADHDIGIQIFGELTREETEEVIRACTEITDTYALAMPTVAVNGIDYTANVISEPERFHLLSGRTCLADDEVVVTEFVAGDLGASIGDTLTIAGDGGSSDYVISGIYACANDMGDNIGLSRAGYLRIGRDLSQLWCEHYFLADPAQREAITLALETAYGGDVHVHANTWPGLSGIIAAMQALMAVMLILTVVFILIITTMTASKILRAERRDRFIYQAIGFTQGQLRLSLALRFALAALLGAALGSILAAWLTDPLVSFIMKSAGISSFASHPSAANTLLPAVLVVLLFSGFAYAFAGSSRRGDMTMLAGD